MQISQVFGISPKFALQLHEAGINSLSDLAKVSDLAAFSHYSNISLELLIPWHNVANNKIAQERFRWKMLAAFAILGVGFSALIGTWFYKLSAGFKYFDRGNIFYDQSNWDMAVNQYMHALELKPDLAAAHNNLGLALFYKGEYDRAGVEFHKAADLNDVKAMFNLGIIYEEVTPNPSLARHWYQKAAEAESTDIPYPKLGSLANPPAKDVGWEKQEKPIMHEN